MDDFENEEGFEDIAKPRAATQQRPAENGLPNGYQQLSCLSSRYGCTVRRCAEFHWQLMDGTDPLVDFWPSTRSYRFNKAPAGSKKRNGGADRIIADVDGWMSSAGRVRVQRPKQQPPRPSVDEQPFTPEATIHQPTPADAFADLAGAVSNAVSGALNQWAEKLRPLFDALHQPDPEPEPTPEPTPERVYPEVTLKETDDVAGYLVALHALILRADKLSPREIHEQALEFGRLFNGPR